MNTTGTEKILLFSILDKQGDSDTMDGENSTVQGAQHR